MERPEAAQLREWEWASWDRLGVWLEPSAGRDKAHDEGKRRTDRLLNFWLLNGGTQGRTFDGVRFTEEKIAFVAFRGNGSERRG
ncbi:hypothetical protein VZT92_006522 [Zoarces viviparus]|uniref:Uncharacterized protein n=1 Tax=Zoarces viviparus TaxID=48416 RepID=A0AAW1FRF5_ZOAVI